MIYEVRYYTTDKYMEQCRIGEFSHESLRVQFCSTYEEAVKIKKLYDMSSWGAFILALDENDADAFDYYEREKFIVLEDIVQTTNSLDDTKSESAKEIFFKIIDKFRALGYVPEVEARNTLILTKYQVKGATSGNYLSEISIFISKKAILVNTSFMSNQGYLTFEELRLLTELSDCLESKREFIDEIA